jgi:hypothetical protein
MGHAAARRKSPPWFRAPLKTFRKCKIFLQKLMIGASQQLARKGYEIR